MLKKDTLTEFTRYIIFQMVDHPEEINITETNVNGVVVIEARVNKKDVGRVVGRKGQTVESIRSLLHCMASKNNKRIILQVEENE